MSEGNEYVLSAVLSLKDRMTAGLRSAGKSMDGLRSTASSASRGLRELDRQRVRPTISIRDNATSGIGRIRNELSGLSGRAYTATVNIKQQGMEKIKGGLNSLSNGVFGVGSQMLGGAGIAFGAYDTLKTAMNFEQGMSSVFATIGLDKSIQANAAQMEALTNKAIEMGAKTSFSATQSAEAFNYMAMAGWKTEEMMGGIEGIMNLAAASGEDLGRVSDIVTDALTGFGLQAKDSAHFADVLAKTASNSNTNVGMLGYSFKYVAPLAGALKYSIEDVNVALGMMANAGVKGEQAGTSLRSIMTRLIEPPEAAAMELNRLGISVKNSDGTMKPFSQTMKDLRKAFSGMSEAEKASAAATIAGQEAMSGFLSIVNTSDKDFEKLTNEINNANGAAEEMSKIKMDNLAGDISLLGSAWETLQITIAKGAGADGLRDFVQAGTRYISTFTEKLKDGLQLNDITSMVSMAVKDLKDKFLAFDGVGSILAGGVLIGSLYKIISVSKRAADGIKGIFGKYGGGVMGGGQIPNQADNLQDMSINANTVIVNAKGLGNQQSGTTTSGTGGIEAGGAGSSNNNQPKGWKAKAKAGLAASKGAIAGGAALSAGLNALSYFGAVEEGNARKQEAKTQYDEANTKFFEAENAWTEAKLRGAPQEELVALGAKRSEAYNDRELAKQNIATVEKDVDKSTDIAAGEAIGGTLGTVIGGGIGAALGGPVGAMIGMSLGETVGSFIGSGIGAHAEDIKSAISGAIDTAGDIWNGLTDGASTAITGFMDSAGPAIMGFFEGAGTAVGGFCDSVLTLGGMAFNGLLTVAGTAFEGIVSGVTTAGSGIISGFETALSTVKGAWEGLVGWFSDLFSRIASTASNALSGIGSTISSAIGIGHNATGTSRWEGGLTEVNEHGGEIIDLPEGSRIYPHATTMGMLKETFGDGGGNTPTANNAPVITVNVSGNSFTVREEADINKIAYAIMEQYRAASENYGGAYL